MEDSIRDTEAIYNDYVKYYNEAGDSKAHHIPLLAELSRIEETVKERVAELGEMLRESKTLVIENLESITKESLNEESEIKDWEEKTELRDEIIDSLKFSIENAGIYTDLLADFKNLDKKVEDLYKGLDLDIQELGTSLLMLAIETTLPKFIQAKYHRTALWGLNGKIIDQNYPKELKYYKDLPEEEKPRLTSKESHLGVGAPIKDEAPQEKIEEIVQECIRDRKSKRFIHQSGPHEGKGNKVQIYEYIRTNYPNMVKGTGRDPEKGLSKRQFFRRIKEALPDSMT
ncbi:MAG TPA: hypothetical protein VF181_10100 [Balneolaceae bacterium]